LLPGVAAVLQGKHFASASLGAELFGTVAIDHCFRDDVSGTVATNNVDVGRDHEVVFYPNDESFMDGFARFAKSALNAGNPVVVVAAKSHCSGILERLSQVLDVDSAIKGGRFIVADANEVLSTFMENDVPLAARVSAAADRLIRRADKAATREHSRIAMCGELAPTLLAQGKTEAAILVERLFDDVSRTHNLDVLCGYVLSAYPSGQDTRILERICAEHSAVHMQ
jgi:hypothetical protein